MTYREMSVTSFLPIAASMSPLVLSISSLSKAFGIPGIRIGWAISADSDLMHRMLCAEEYVTICGSVLDEAVACAALADRAGWIRRSNQIIRERLDIVRTWITSDARFEWIEPDSGCTCFVRIRPDIDVDIDRFYDVLLRDFGTYIGPGHWFDHPRTYFRIGYAWPLSEELTKGLKSLSQALDKTGTP